MARRRIVFLINSLAGGGAERVLCTLLEHSHTECEEFDVALALLDDEPAAYARPDWVRLVQLDAGGSMARSFAEVRRLLAREKPALTVSFLTRANVANVVASRLRNAPCVISERVNTSAHLGVGVKGALSRALVRFTYPRATRVVAVSQGVADDLSENFGVPASRIEVVPNPVDIESIGAKAREAPSVAIDVPYVLGAGRLTANKNFALLIEAFALSGIAGKLVIIGDGPERSALESLIAQQGLAGRVLMPGFVANPYPLMQRASLFVLPSNAEGFPNGLVEAMATGVAVISTNCASGPSEILAKKSRDAINGLTYAPYGVLTPPNEPEPMAEALRALQDDARRRDYAARARARAEYYSVARAKDRYWDIIRQWARP